jgi:hypothetical protein
MNNSDYDTVDTAKILNHIHLLNRCKCEKCQKEVEEMRQVLAERSKPWACDWYDLLGINKKNGID